MSGLELDLIEQDKRSGVEVKDGGSGRKEGWSFFVGEGNGKIEAPQKEDIVICEKSKIYREF